MYGRLDPLLFRLKNGEMRFLKLVDSGAPSVAFDLCKMGELFPLERKGEEI